MATPIRATPSEGDTRHRLSDPDLVELVDAIVAAVDPARDFEIARLRSALEPFGGSTLFVDELRLNATGWADHGCICGGVS